MTKRNFDRTQYQSECEIRHQGNVYRGKTLNLSLQGLLVEIKEKHNLKLDDHVELTLYLNAMRIILEFQARVAHSFVGKVGFHFTSTDSETFGHLRRLLELNFADAEKVYEEIKEIKSNLPPQEEELPPDP